MGKPEWGRKRICSSCSLKYYDFNQSPIICPSCNTEFDPDLFLKARKGKSLSPKIEIENNTNLSNSDDLETNIEDDGDSDEIVKGLDDTAGVNIEDDISFEDDENEVDEIEITSVDIEEDKN
jgi:uncharacterized protein (TIGR02300 family)